ncbi:FG-GAP repeat protein [Streptomyces griseoluteus]|uniref:FG-GAP repeat protein n=1 Tax=Streptomyces griseoluteus TaxID=29306 RepID=UPI0036FC7E05
MRTRVLALALTGLVAPLALSVPAPAAPAAAPYDFDGDGRIDLAVGAPDATTGSALRDGPERLSP